MIWYIICLRFSGCWFGEDELHHKRRKH